MPCCQEDGAAYDVADNAETALWNDVWGAQARCQMSGASCPCRSLMYITTRSQVRRTYSAACLPCVAYDVSGLAAKHTRVQQLAARSMIACMTALPKCMLRGDRCRVTAVLRSISEHPCPAECLFRLLGLIAVCQTGSTAGLQHRCRHTAVRSPVALACLRAQARCRARGARW